MKNFQIPKALKRFVNKAILVLSLTLSSYLVQSPIGARENAQGQSPKTWRALQKASSRITACRVTWQLVMRVRPNSHVDVEKRVARAVEQAQQQRVEPQEITAVSRSARREAQNDIKGQSSTSLLNFVRVGKTISCDIEFVEAKTRATEFYDGKNSVFLERQVNGQVVPMQGYLRRDPKEILSHSAPSWQIARFMLGMALEQKYSPYNPAFSVNEVSLTEDANGNPLLEKKTIIKEDAGQFPALLRLTFSKEHLQPVSYELLNLLYRDGKGASMGRVSVSGYRKYANDIWFPSKVVVDAGAYTTEATLVKAVFNEAVDPQELRLPPKALIIDSRFGFGKSTVTYTPKNGVIPTDEEVRKMLNLDTEGAKAKAEVSKSANSKEAAVAAMPIAPIAGLLFIALGAVMWTSARRKEGE